MQSIKFRKIKPGMLLSTLPDMKTVRVVGKHNGSKTVHAYPVTGYAEDVRDLTMDEIEGRIEPDPLDQIHPMLARSLSSYKTLHRDELLADPNWALEEKYDGERQILTFKPLFSTRNGYADDMVLFRATTRVVGKNTGLLADNTTKLIQLHDVPVPPSGATVFDVELMHEDGFRRLRSIMGSDDQRALDLQAEYGEVYAVVFDVLWFGGTDLRDVPFAERREILELWHSTLEDEYRGWWKLSPIAWEEDEKRSMLSDILSRGGEGAMLKKGTGTYTDTTVPKRRSSDVLKVKPFLEEDVIIYGFEMGQGEYNQDKFGAIHFAQFVPKDQVTEEMEKNALSANDVGDEALSDVLEVIETGPSGHYLVHFGSCSGFTDQQEAEFRKSPTSFFGKVMEVKYQGRWPDTGLMRHPNFVRMRGDKPASDCVYVPVE